MLEVKEGLQLQTKDERIVYKVDFSGIFDGLGTSAAAPTVTAFDTSDDTEVTSTLFPTNSPTVTTNVVTLSLLQDMTVGKTYRVDVKVTDGGTQIFERFFRVRCPL